MKKLFLTLIASFTFSASVIAFSDVDSDYKYHEAIYFINDGGIVEGYLDDTFKPEQKINRAELLKIIVESKYSQEEIDLALDEYRSKDYWYVDLPDVSIDSWYGPYVRLAVRDGIIQGYQDNTFRPSKNVNFVEALKIMLVANNISYDQSASLWYQDLVDAGSAANLIPLDITAFDQEITRGQMADMITRMIKFQDETLDEYLGSASDVRQTFDDIRLGRSKLDAFTQGYDYDEGGFSSGAIDINPGSDGFAEAIAQYNFVTDCDNYIDALEECRPIDCDVPDYNLLSNKIVSIQGLNEEGDCVYQASTMAGTDISCEFSEGGRKEYARQQKMQYVDELTFITSYEGGVPATTVENEELWNVLADECEINYSSQTQEQCDCENCLDGKSSLQDLLTHNGEEATACIECDPFFGGCAEGFTCQNYQCI